MNQQNDMCVHRIKTGKGICGCLKPLIVKKCTGEECKFFLTAEQKAENDRKSRERLESLPEADQQVIRDKYYNGKISWD